MSGLETAVVRSRVDNNNNTFQPASISFQPQNRTDIDIAPPGATTPDGPQFETINQTFVDPLYVFPPVDLKTRPGTPPTFEENLSTPTRRLFHSSLFDESTKLDQGQSRSNIRRGSLVPVMSAIIPTTRRGSDPANIELNRISSPRIPYPLAGPSSPRGEDPSSPFRNVALVGKQRGEGSLRDPTKGDLAVAKWRVSW